MLSSPAAADTHCSVMATDSLVRELQARVRELEEELARVRSRPDTHRAKITKMSAEVVDSNPYR